MNFADSGHKAIAGIIMLSILVFAVIAIISLSCSASTTSYNLGPRGHADAEIEQQQQDDRSAEEAQEREFEAAMGKIQIAIAESAIPEKQQAAKNVAVAIGIGKLLIIGVFMLSCSAAVPFFILKGSKWAERRVEQDLERQDVAIDQAKANVAKTWNDMLSVYIDPETGQFPLRLSADHLKCLPGGAPAADGYKLTLTISDPNTGYVINTGSVQPPHELLAEGNTNVRLAGVQTKRSEPVLIGRMVNEDDE